MWRHFAISNKQPEMARNAMNFLNQNIKRVMLILNCLLQKKNKLCLSITLLIVTAGITWCCANLRYTSEVKQKREKESIGTGFQYLARKKMK